MKSILGLALLSVSSLASAQEPQVVGVSQIDVSYSDLNLHHPRGAAVMMGRIRAAASQVCGSFPATRELIDFARYRACVAVTVRNAVADLNAITAARVPTSGTIVVTRR